MNKIEKVFRNVIVLAILLTGYYLLKEQLDSMSSYVFNIIFWGVGLGITGFKYINKLIIK